MWITITTNNNLFYGVLMGKLKGKYGKSFEVAGLVEKSPGVMVNDNYKSGEDKALDATLKKLQGNPSSLDKSGFSPVKRVKKNKKNKEHIA